jgi:hypothetical protein
MARAAAAATSTSTAAPPPRRGLSLSLLTQGKPQSSSSLLSSATSTSTKPARSSQSDSSAKRPASSLSAAAAATAAAVEKSVASSSQQQKRASVTIDLTIGGSNSSSSSSSSINNGAQKKSSSAAGTADSKQKAPLTMSAAVAALTAAPPSLPKQKRPTLKSKRTLPPATAKAHDDAADPSPRLQKKVKSSSNSGGELLAKLVQNVAAAGGQDGYSESLSGGLPTIEPEDYWKNLRSWDFVSHFSQSVGGNNNSIVEAADPDAVLRQRKPLPDVFINAKQYTALWAPLCLAECRAQLLQEAALNMTTPIPVMVHPAAQHCSNGPSGARYHRRGGNNNALIADSFVSDYEETAGYVKVEPIRGRPSNKYNNRRNGNGGGGGGGGDAERFMTHDVCLLLAPRYHDILDRMQKNNNNSSNSNNDLPAPPFGKTLDDVHAWEGAGFIGQVENPRNSANGLILKVSKQKWAKIGSSLSSSSDGTEMYLVKLGSNITALREFTALCRVDQLPMKRFLLADQYSSSSSSNKSNGNKQKNKLSCHQSSEQLLRLMGGETALGKGFLDYARQKFNASQLTAIAASAHEYGEGGFTCIKGPPGTGST